MWVLSLDWEDSLEESMAIHFTILCLENPMDRKSWQAAVHSVAESDMTEATSQTWHILI